MIWLKQFLLTYPSVWTPIFPVKILVFPNNKPWVTKELKNVINKKKSIFYTGNSQEKKEITREVRNEIRKAKRMYKDMVEHKYSSGELRAAWKGIKSMSSINHRNSDSDRKPLNIVGISDADLPNTFNDFYSRFEKHDFSSNISLLRQSLSSDCDIVISQECVRDLLKRVNIRKAPGPDHICGRTLHYCADQLSSVLHHIFQRSLDSNQIPAIWKTSTVIPVPKITNPRQLNDFRPVALTSLIMKILEKILKNLVLSIVDEKLDPLQFAYQSGRGVEDAKLLILNNLYKHLEKPQAHVRLLFADFSSAFNTMQPHLLIERLLYDFKLPHQIVLWILDFLTDRVQRVSVNGRFSDSLIMSTGSPQGCVLSPLLFIMYTDGCRSSQEGSSYLVKFSDDTALLSLLQGSESLGLKCI